MYLNQLQTNTWKVGNSRHPPINTTFCPGKLSYNKSYLSPAVQQPGPSQLYPPGSATSAPRAAARPLRGGAGGRGRGTVRGPALPPSRVTTSLSIGGVPSGTEMVWYDLISWEQVAVIERVNRGQRWLAGRLLFTAHLYSSDRSRVVSLFSNDYNAHGYNLDAWAAFFN